MKRALTVLWIVIMVLLAVAMFVLGAMLVHAAPLTQDATATPNATQLMQTAQASLATPDFSSAVKYGDLAEISMLLLVALIIGIVFILWLASKFLLPGGEGG